MCTEQYVYEYIYILIYTIYTIYSTYWTIIIPFDSISYHRCIVGIMSNFERKHTRVYIVVTVQVFEAIFHF